MDEDNIPLYEPVDEVLVKSNVLAKSNYEKLINTTSDHSHEEYQEPHLNMSYVHHTNCSNTSNEVRQLRIGLRRVKIMFFTGALTTLLLVAVFCVTFIVMSTRSTMKTKNDGPIQQVIVHSNVTVNTSYHTANVSIFNNCLQEIKTCHFRSFDDGRWLSCDTDNLALNKDVSHINLFSNPKFFLRL